MIEVKQFACMRLFHLQILNCVESQGLHTLHSFSLGRLSLSLIRIQVYALSVVFGLQCYLYSTYSLVGRLADGKSK